MLPIAHHVWCTLTQVPVALAQAFSFLWPLCCFLLCAFVFFVLLRLALSTVRWVAGVTGYFAQLGEDAVLHAELDDGAGTADLTTEFRQHWYNELKGQFGYAAKQDACVLDHWLRGRMREFEGPKGARIHPSTIANSVPLIVARAMLPNRAERRAAGMWRTPQSQAIMREYRRATSYSWLDWLLGLEKSPVAP